MSAIQELANALTDEDVEVRESAAQELAQLDDPTAAKYLLHALDDDEGSVRMWGAYGLGMLAAKDHRVRLKTVLENDSEPLVQLWAAFALLNIGDPKAGDALVAFLRNDEIDLRNNAADALATLADPASVRPKLEALLSEEGSVRGWAAAVLCGWGHEDALEVWREALVDPDTRLDAAVAARYLGTPDAAKDLLRLLAELPREELSEPAPIGEEVPLAEILSTPLLELGLDSVLEEAETNDGLRAEILLFLAKNAPADPDVLDHVQQFAERLPPKQAGAEVAELASELEPKEAADFLASFATIAPRLVVPALNAMETGFRESLFDQIAAAFEEGRDDSYLLSPLLELLRKSPYAQQVADVAEPAPPEGFDDEPATDGLGVPTAENPFALGDEEVPQEGDPVGEIEGGEDEYAVEDDVAPIIERMAAGIPLSDEEQVRIDAFLAELGVSQEEFLEQLSNELPEQAELVPPEPDDAGRRMLAVGALMKRVSIEDQLKEKKLNAAAAKKELDALQKWIEDEELFGSMSLGETDLFEAKLGEWTEHDRHDALGSGEALAALLWAFGLVKTLSAEKSTDVPALLAALPVGKPTDAFLDSLNKRDTEELLSERDLWETWHWRAQQEELARQVMQEGPEAVGIEPEAMLEDLAHSGFDAASVEKKLGKKAVLPEAIRFLGKRAGERLLEEGRLPQMIQGDFPYKGKPFALLTDPEVERASRAFSERYRALHWLEVGGSWDEAADAQG